MKEIRLKTLIDHINAKYDEIEDNLKKERKELIDNAWDHAIINGSLKQDSL